MGFFTGIQLYGKAFGILFSRKFWWFLLFPVIILLLLFIGGNILISLAYRSQEQMAFTDM